MEAPRDFLFQLAHFKITLPKQETRQLIMEFMNFYRSYTVDSNGGNQMKEKSSADDQVLLAIPK